jgi:hypothetical protein
LVQKKKSEIRAFQNKQKLRKLILSQYQRGSFSLKEVVTPYGNSN